MVVSWKTFWVSLGAALSSAVAGALVLYRVPLTLVVPGLVGLVAVCIGLATRVVHGSHMFRQLALHTRSQMLRSLSVAFVAHAFWIVVFVLRPQHWLLWAVVLLALALAEYGLAHGHEYLLTKVTARPKAARPAPEEPHAENFQGYTPADEFAASGSNKSLTVFKAGLTQAGYGWLRVSSQWSPVRDFGIQFHVKVPSARALKTSRSNKEATASTFGIESAEEIAKGLGEVLNRGLKTEWIGITQQEFAGTYGVLVTTQDTMTRLYPFEDTPEWTSIEELALAGYGRDAEPYYLSLKQHGQDIGATESGKTSLIHNKIAHVTRCADAVQWVCGVEKLYDLVAGWIEPYRGHDLPLPIDWIAYGQADVLEMLVAALNIARYRQRVPLALRRNWPKIVITLDEASFALRNRSMVAEYQGNKYTAAQLVAMLTQGAASAGVYVHLATQRSTNSQFGDEGGDTTAQMGYTAAFRSRDQGEVGRLVGDYNLPMPRHQGAYWLDPGSGALPVLLKAPYIQQVGADRKILHDGLTIVDVAWNRRHFHTSLDEGSATHAGEYYLARHTRMTPELEQYLTGMSLLPDEVDATDAAPTFVSASAPASSGPPEMSDAARVGYEAALATVASLRAGVQDAVPATATRLVDAPSVPHPTITVVRTLPRGSRQDRILALMAERGDMRTSEIVEALREQEGEDEVRNPTSISNLLSAMVDAGVLHRLGKGHYTRPGLSVVERTG